LDESSKERPIVYGTGCGRLEDNLASDRGIAPHHHASEVQQRGSGDDLSGSYSHPRAIAAGVFNMRSSAKEYEENIQRIRDLLLQPFHVLFAVSEQYVNLWRERAGKAAP
jgi:hypothetical protein